MVDITTDIVVDRPRAVVSEYAANPDNAPEWYRNIQSVIWQTSGPLSVGSRMAFVAHFLGRELSYIYEIRALVPGEKLVMATHEGPFPMETTYTWSAVDPARTRMTLRNRGEPSGFSRIAAPAMASMMRAANRKDLENIKRILEAG